MISHLLDFFNLSSIKFTLKEKKRRLKEILHIACVWRWQLSRLPSRQSADIVFYYLGRKSEREVPISYLGLNEQNKPTASIKAKAVVSEFPMPGAICLPFCLSTVILLKNRTPEEVLMGFEKRKRRLINSQTSQFKLEKITTAEDVVRLNEAMLMPYANAKFGLGAYNFPEQKLLEMTFKTGQFNLCSTRCWQRKPYS